MKTMTATIDVDAPPENVWDILTDLGRYRDWNPLFVEAAGDVAVGQRIMLRSKHPANGRLMTVKPKIIAAKSGAELRWTSSLPGIMSGEHSFTRSPQRRNQGRAERDLPRPAHAFLGQDLRQR